MTAESARVLVTGATGSQGGEVARRLLAGGLRVAALTRDTRSAAAIALQSAGAELIQGDMNDSASLLRAASGMDVVFSVQRPDADGSDSERRHGYALIDAARAAGVSQFIHTSVCEAGRHTSFPRWESRYWYQKYWTDKWDIEERVRGAGFPHWTILKPAFLMDNFIKPKVAHMFPSLRNAELATAFAPSTRLQSIAAADVAAFTAAAIAEPQAFDGHSIDLAAEAPTMDEFARVISRVSGVSITTKFLSPAEARAAGMHAGWVRSQEWTNEAGYRADIAALARYGVPLTSFADWLSTRRAELPFPTGG